MRRWPRNWNMDLTDEEYLVLDGKCRPEIQAYVDRAKSFFAKIEAGLPEYLAAILAEAERTGVMQASNDSGSTCTRCGAVGSHQPLYVRGPKKGQENPRKRRVYYGRVSVCGQYFCHGCWEVVVEKIKAAIEPLYEVKIPGVETKAILDVELRCDKCERSFWKSDMEHQSRFSYGGYLKCPTTNCKGELRHYRNAETKIISVEALKVARRMLEV